MEEAGVSPEDYGKYVDKIAAQIILQDYLNNQPKSKIAAGGKGRFVYALEADYLWKQ